MKKLLVIGLGLIVIIVGVALYLYTSLDSILVKAIEHYGTAMTGTDVRVAGVDISMGTGRGTIRGLRIANPPGFSSNDAFSLDQITLQIELVTLGGSPVVITELSIDAPKVRVEVNKDRKTNLDAIKANLEAYRGESGKERTEGEGKQVLLRIEELHFSKGMITVTGVGKDEVVAELPSVSQHSVGGESGATGAEIGKVLLTTMVGTAVRAAARSGLDRLLDEKLGGKGGKAAKDLLRSILK